MTARIPPGEPGGTTWRAERCDAVLRFATRSALPDGGFGWLDATGDVDPSHDLELWINARMTYVFSLASVLEDRVHPLAEHGVCSMQELFADQRHGGWYRSVRSFSSACITIFSSCGGMPLRRVLGGAISARRAMSRSNRISRSSELRTRLCTQVIATSRVPRVTFSTRCRVVEG